jgi:hypothetical protein
MADQQVTRRWLIDLGKLTAARSSHDEAADFVASCAPMLAMRFPDPAFNVRSLEAVAAQCKYIPTYGELVALLRAWWQAYRPPQAALPPPPSRQRGEPTPDEIQHVTRVVEDTIAALRSAVQPPEDHRPVARCLSREQLNQAYERAGVQGPVTPASPGRPASCSVSNLDPS